MINLCISLSLSICIYKESERQAVPHWRERCNIGRKPGAVVLLGNSAEVGGTHALVVVEGNTASSHGLTNRAFLEIHSYLVIERHIILRKYEE